MTKQQAIQSIELSKERILDLNDKIWDYAETAFAEFKSVDLFVHHLKEEGFEVEVGVGDVPTAFTGTYGSGKPVIGLLAEYDALSGLSQQGGCPTKTPIVDGEPGHGCGHNSLGAAAYGAALAVKNYLEATGKSGTVILYGCPGEEGGSGKAFMAREGVFDNCDVAITWHPGSTTAVHTGSSNANYQVSYKFNGISAHAASAHNGRSALDALELMNIGVQFLREHMIPEARVHYAITNTGGYSPNVVQPIAEVLYLIRSPKTPQVEELYQRVNAIADGAALMTGTTVEKTFIKACSNVVPNTTLEKVLYKNFTELPHPTYTAEEIEFGKSIIASYETPPQSPMAGLIKKFGNVARELYSGLFTEGQVFNDFVLPHLTSDAPSPGSTDVGDVSWVCPTAQINVVTTPSGMPGHSWQYVACNNTSIAHKGTLYASKVMAGACIDMLEDTSIIEAAKAELKERIAEDGGKYLCPIPKGVKPRSIAPKK